MKKIKNLKWLTVHEVADSLNVDRSTVRKWIVNGVLPAYRPARTRNYRIKSDDFNAFVDNRVKLTDA